jgi:hypothetical protein
MAFTAEQRSTVDAWLAKNGKNAICSNCGSTEVLVHDYLHVHPVMADGHVADRGLAVVSLGCKVCGLVRSFDARSVGIST